MDDPETNFRRDRDRGHAQGPLPLGRPFQGPSRCLHLQGQRLHLLGEVGGAELRDHLLRQHRVRHVDRLPVRHNGGLDTHTLLGKF